LRARQLRASADPGKHLAIAKGIVQRGYHRRGVRIPVAGASTIKELMRLESEGAERHWARWKARLASAWPEHDFDGRDNPRYRARFRAVTRTNAVLNYSYALLESAARTTIHRVGLLPDIGFLHVPTKPGKEPLVYDFMELGRAWVDDAVLDWFKKPANRDRKAFKRSSDWAVRLAPEKVPELVAHVSPRIRTETLWHDARDIVKRL
jgi:CRISPR-associated endonuclease Cas1